MLYILGIDLLFQFLLVLLPYLLALLPVLKSVADLVLHRYVIIFPVEFELAAHVVEGCIEYKLRRPMYIFLRWT